MTRFTDGEANGTAVSIAREVTALHVLFHGIEIVPFSAAQIAAIARAY